MATESNNKNVGTYWIEPLNNARPKAFKMSALKAVKAMTPIIDCHHLRPQMRVKITLVAKKIKMIIGKISANIAPCVATVWKMKLPMPTMAHKMMRSLISHVFMCFWRHSESAKTAAKINAKLLSALTGSAQKAAESLSQ